MSRTTRRKFAQTIAAVTAALPVIVHDLPAQAKPPSPLAIALTGVVSAQSGRYLDADEMQRIYDNFKEYVPFVERLRAFELVNADEPDFTFQSLVERW